MVGRAKTSLQAPEESKRGGGKGKEKRGRKFDARPIGGGIDRDETRVGLGE